MCDIVGGSAPAASVAGSDTASKPVALVTGATGGMGFEIVKELLGTHHVIAVGRNPEKLALLEQLGAVVWSLDITDYETIAAHTAGLKRLDVLVNAAAIAADFSVANAPVSAWQKQLEVNVTAPAVLTGQVLPLLRESCGTVIFIGSGASTRPVPGSVVYAASKHALQAVADSMRLEESKYRVRTVTIAPGQTDTAMLRGLIAAADYESEKYIRPESIARTVRFVVDAPDDMHLANIAVRPRQEITRKA